MDGQVRVRYAPSPTGHLHIGGARTALFNYLYARSKQGKFIIRFEDTDQTRHVETGVDNQLSGLKWLGIDWDESVDIGGEYGPYSQLKRLPLYQPFIDQLVENKQAYRCYCSEEELAQERTEQEAEGEMLSYSGKCRHLTAQQIVQYENEGRKPTLRFRVPTNETIVIEDQVRGHVEFASNDIGDFIILRPDGIPMYNFAVVLDDHLMKITHVIRAEEHLSNTPRQLLIYQALGVQPPQFAHLSLILNPDRKKMSKRDESIVQFVEQYKDMGYLPEAVLNFITLLGWSPKGEEEIFSKQDIIDQFSLDRISKSPAVFDMDKLNWMNNLYLKKTESARVVELAIPHLQKAGKIPQHVTETELEWVSALVQLYQDQLPFVAEIVSLSQLFFTDEIVYDDEARAVLAEEHAPIVLASFLQQVELADSFNAEQMKVLLKQVQTETGFKGKPLFMSIRVALTGQMHGPDLNASLFLLGRTKVIARLQSLLS
ncbi:MAG: glutamyl-tRNA synthetase [Bacilli bacterium]|nr:glutamyl-tRNA synthetase [Bacilli bacterium]